MPKLVSIKVIAEEYGVTTQTIRNWCKEGMFEVKRTKGGHVVTVDLFGRTMKTRGKPSFTAV